jgi:hypothetical protein
MATVNRSRPITRERRSRSDVSDIRMVMFRLLQDEHPMTVRQVFYRMVNLKAIDKTEAEYKQTVVRILGQMRKEKVVPYGWIADSTRWMRKPDSYSSLGGMLEHQIDFYRRALWDDQPHYVEIWLEKDALSGVLYQETAQFDVPLMVTRGYASLSFLSGAADAIVERAKPTYLYYFGDYDPTGVHIPISVEQSLRKMAPDAEIHFKRIAVTAQQIGEWNLPTRPTKKSDSRSKGFEGESVEVDAIPPWDLRQLARDLIVSHIDPQVYDRTLATEQLERESLQQIVDYLNRP